MVRLRPILVRNRFLQLFLGLFHILRVGKPDAVAHAKHMRVHRDRGDAKGVASDHVCGLFAHARQGLEGFDARGHFAAILGNEDARGLENVPSFGVEKAAAFDVGKERFLRHGGNRLRRVGNGEELCRAFVHHHVRALRGEDGCNQQLKRRREVQRGFRVWIRLAQDGEGFCFLRFGQHFGAVLPILSGFV